MKLTAAIEALKQSVVVLTIAALYVRKGITEWSDSWKKRGWKTAGRKPVKNVDVWQQLGVLAQCHEVEGRRVKGCSGDRENDIADQLANRGIDEL